MRRRTFIGSAVAAALTLPATANATTNHGMTLTLPKPTGPHPIGTKALHLVDHDRQDPWWSTPHHRELMVTLWYPTRQGGRVPWMTPGALAHYRPELAEFLGHSPDTIPGQPPIDTPVSLDGVDFPVTTAREGAPVPRCPTVVYSPGFGAGREMGTTLVSDLASRGYLVVAVSHTYEAAEVEFPGGRVELGQPELVADPVAAMTIRRADVRFVLDRLGLTRVGVFGHSLGGATAAQAMAKDSRVVAGINLDGSFMPDISPVSAPPAEVDLALIDLAGQLGDRPFMIMGSIGIGPDEFGAMTSVVWHHLAGWRRFLSLAGSTHGSYTDHEPFLHQLAAAGVIPSAVPWLGTIPPDRAIAAERAYIAAFFDRWLRGHDNHLLDGPSSDYPEVNFY
jgi:pimeloyl-ACP methyl ester carboxylesterase